MKNLNDYKPEDLKAPPTFQKVLDKATINFADIKGIEEKVQEFDGKKTTRFLYAVNGQALPWLLPMNVHREIVEFNTEKQWKGVEIRRTGAGMETRYKIIPFK